MFEGRRPVISQPRVKRGTSAALGYPALLLIGAQGLAQDNQVPSANPPIVFARAADSRSGQTFNFANATDKVIHGVAVHWKDKNGSKKRVTVVDTIQANTTYKMRPDEIPLELWAAILPDSTAQRGSFTVTCTTYSTPIKIDICFQ